MSNAGHVKFNWNRYIDLAEFLLNSIPENDDDESKDRCGISRAYYAAFHRAEKFLRNINQTIDIHNKGSHENIIKIFSEFGRNNLSYRFISEELKLLKIQRKKADYDDKYFSFESRNILLKNELRKSITRARKIIEKIENLESEEKLK